MTIEICGTLPLSATVRLKIRPYPPSAAMPSCIRAPPEETKPDHRGAAAIGQLQHAGDRVGVRLAQRPAGVAGILGVTEHRSAADGARASEHAVALAGLVAHGVREDLGADELQRAGIAQRLQTLERA